jgi:RNA polymerase sigma-70 factor (ECF subfamily)
LFREARRPHDGAVADRADKDLLAAWRSGDQRAGNELFERYFDLLERFFATKVSEGAEDLIQGTFAACVAGRERIHHDQYFRAYLLGIARHELIAYYKQARRRRGEPDDGELSALRDGGASPTARAAARDEERALLGALRSLSLDQQIVLELHYWEDLSTEEVARVLSIPRGTVKSRLRLAREALKARLRADPSPDVGERTVTNLDAWARSLRDSLSRRE